MNCPGQISGSPGPREARRQRIVRRNVAARDEAVRMRIAAAAHARLRDAVAEAEVLDVAWQLADPCRDTSPSRPDAGRCSSSTCQRLGQRRVVVRAEQEQHVRRRLRRVADLPADRSALRVGRILQIGVRHAAAKQPVVNSRRRQSEQRRASCESSTLRKTPSRGGATPVDRATARRTSRACHACAAVVTSGVSSRSHRRAAASRPARDPESDQLQAFGAEARE